MARFFDPWTGINFKPGDGLLVISESAYCWQTNGHVECPQPDHPSGNTVNHWAIEHFEERGSEGRYAASVTRALCGVINPSRQERIAAWSQVAYSIYVQDAMPNQHARPTNVDMQNASRPFLDLLEELRPARVLVTSLTAWGAMPLTYLQPTDYLQAYRLEDGQLSWCQAVRHPRVNSWKNLAREISELRSLDLEKLVHSS